MIPIALTAFLNQLTTSLLAKFETGRMRKALIELFEILNTKIEDRDPYLEPELAAFPYVNGGLFANKKIEIPNFADEIRTILQLKISIKLLTHYL